LQFIAQKYLGITPTYKVLKIEGNSEKVFTACAIIGDRKFMAAQGPNKKEAEQSSAHSALQILSLEDPVIAEFIQRTLGQKQKYSPESPITKMSNLFQNSKSLLQHVTQKYQLSSAHYKRVYIDVNKGKKSFYVAVSMKGRQFPKAKSHKVKEAERYAARNALEVLSEEYYTNSAPLNLSWSNPFHTPVEAAPLWHTSQFGL